jgi:putative oxidoreductase
VTPAEALSHPWLTARARIGLGLLFIAAALPKIVDPPSFAHMIYNYRIVPGALINAMALVLPWAELLAGIALVLGIWPRSATALVGAMLAVFIVAISINLARGHAIDCGCFDVRDAGKTVAQRLFDMKADVVRDLGMMVLAGLSWFGATSASQSSRAQ